jgi:hypothetical protein
MKKLLLVLTAVAVSLAFVGVAVAKEVIGCPVPCETKLVPAAMGGKLPKAKAPKIDIPKFGKIAGPKTVVDNCGNCITIPGQCYATYPVIVDLPPKTVKVPVYKDLCKGASKGQCMPCGFCVPVKWDCKWKTTVICGETTITVPGGKDKTEKPFPVVCKPVPCPPPDCF